MQAQQSRKLGLKFTDILVTVMIAVVFGVIYKIWDSVYSVFSPLFTQADELVYGMWFMAGPFAYLLIRKPGVAILASFAAANISYLIGSAWSMQTVYYGLVQGLAAELIFLAVRYRKSGLVIAGIAGIASAAGSYLVDLIYGYANYEAWMLILKYGLRVISAFLFAGVFAYYIVKAIEATGVTKLIQPVSKEDLDALEQR